MRADRLLSIVLLLQRHHRLKASELAEKLAVTERTIYRDIDALSLAGVPVYTRTGPDGGCFLDEHYRSQLNWFTGAEMQALLYTGSASPLSDLGMEQAMDNAVLKLLSLLPERSRQEAEKMRHRLYLDPSGWYESDDSHPTLPLLKEAVWNDVLIDVTYQNWEGDQHQRTLAPYSLVYKSDRWYLVAESQRSGKMRTYRVSRLSNVRLQSTHFERDPDFDIVAYWQESSARFVNRIPEYMVTMCVRPHLMIYFQSVMVGRYEVLEKGEDWHILKVKYTVFEEARTAVLGLGVDAEVIDPPSLQQAVIEQARALVAKYD